MKCGLSVESGHEKLNFDVLVQESFTIIISRLWGKNTEDFMITYFKSGLSLSDVDECKEGHRCSQKCVNRWGVIGVWCQDGFSLAEGWNNVF